MDQSTVDPAKAGPGRSTGVLLHPTALPGSPVCGSFGEPCRRWLQLLADHDIGVWQMLPLALPDPAERVVGRRENCIQEIRRQESAVTGQVHTTLHRTPHTHADAHYTIYSIVCF